MQSIRIARFRGGPAILALISLVAVTALVAPGGAAAAPKQPTVTSITAKLDQLANRAERLTEQYNATRVEIAFQRRALGKARARHAAADAGYAAARHRLVPMLIAQYQDAGFDSVGAMLTSHDAGAYLDSLATQDLLAQQQAGLVSDLTAARDRAEQAEADANRALAAAQQARDTLDEKRRAVRVEIAKYYGLLSALTASQRNAYVRRDAPTAAEIAAALREPAPTPAAQRAVNYAVDQIGKPYVWAASGPNSFDCSGLTMAAWARGGVKLPHYTVAQYHYGRHVGYNQMKPGDLVFLYSDIHHVELYVGGGLAVSAPQEGEDVMFVRVADYRDVFYGATRLS